MKRKVLPGILILTICLLSSNAYAEEEKDISIQCADAFNSGTSGYHENQPYNHDPRDNPGAMKDIVYNPDAVYGFSPDPESTRLGEYADAIDWTDPEQVAEARAIREAYHASLSELYQMITDMLHEAKPVEEIARAVSQRRNEIRLEALQDKPQELERTKKSNLDTYGHEEGPTPDELYDKYGSWQTVLEKALGTNAGMDACVGLYDEYYDYYDLEETKTEEHIELPEAAYTAEDSFMQVAIDEARDGIYNGDGGPFGSVIVKDGVIVGQGHNCVLKNNDSTWHGEMGAIRDAEANLGTYDLSGTVLYTTGEPCMMCLTACLWANIDHVYYGCTIEDNSIIGFRDQAFDELLGDNRENLKDYLEEMDRDACLKLFDEYNKLYATIY